MLQAFNSLAEGNVELHLIGGAGNKGERRYMAQLQRKYKKDSRIIWHGKVEPEQVFDEIKNLHVLVLPSICLEIFGLNISEALAMGKSVLATRCGGAEMQIENGVNGWLVEPNDAKALKAKMEDIINDVSIIPSMEMSGRKSVISIEEHCQVSTFYRVIVEKKTDIDVIPGFLLVVSHILGGGGHGLLVIMFNLVQWVPFDGVTQNN